MTWDVKVGDRVVCVDDSATHGFWQRRFFGLSRRWVETFSLLKAGQTYTVTLVASGTSHRDGSHEIGIQVAEIEPSHPCGAFQLRRFRPVRTTSIEALRKHLNVIPARKSEEA